MSTKPRKLTKTHVGTATDKRLKDYKIFVFDLDNTLFLHKVDSVFAHEYHNKVKTFLTYLKMNDKLLYIATHNFGPSCILRSMDIGTLFDGVILERRDVSPFENDIKDYTSKKDMILEILNNHKDLSTDDVLFFDDNDYNTDQVDSINVKSVLVDETVGIDFSDIY